MEWGIDSTRSFPDNVFLLQTRPAKVAAKKVESATNHIAKLIAKQFSGL